MFRVSDRLMSKETRSLVYNIYEYSRYRYCCGCDGVAISRLVPHRGQYKVR